MRGTWPIAIPQVRMKPTSGAASCHRRRDARERRFGHRRIDWHRWSIDRFVAVARTRRSALVRKNDLLAVWLVRRQLGSQMLRSNPPWMRLQVGRLSSSAGDLGDHQPFGVLVRGTRHNSVLGNLRVANYQLDLVRGAEELEQAGLVRVSARGVPRQLEGTSARTKQWSGSIGRCALADCADDDRARARQVVGLGPPRPLRLSPGRRRRRGPRRVALGVLPSCSLSGPRSAGEHDVSASPEAEGSSHGSRGVQRRQGRGVPRVQRIERGELIVRIDDEPRAVSASTSGWLLGSTTTTRMAIARHVSLKQAFDLLDLSRQSPRSGETGQRIRGDEAKQKIDLAPGEILRRGRARDGRQRGMQE